MKRSITVILNIASLLIIAKSVNLGYMLMLFFFAGIIPWTNIELPPELMGVLLLISVGLIIIKIVAPKLRIADIISSAKLNQTKSNRLSRAH